MCSREYVRTCHNIIREVFGCASSVSVSEVLQGQQQVLKEKQITTATARLEMIRCNEINSREINFSRNQLMFF